ncbi:uncharacterized protein N7458_004353 [Penicillium daleae]|uniref:Xylanolytic transcriptional activator regulatory domain-containing protein n=1 Tax=Penicillium daleae TaxID=63821 RepID=A0AAD6CA16_9EURO|nr:uncharacterized protein N7458_004353 [Penicillium daleae]KAJ5456089.1 hypothetical protein N7458_004353 [Penicillium daleae]
METTEIYLPDTTALLMAFVYPSPQPTTSANALLDSQPGTSEIQATSSIANQRDTHPSTNDLSLSPNYERPQGPAVDVQSHNGHAVLSSLDLSSQPLNFPLDDATGGFPTSSMDDFTSFMDSVPIPTHPFSPSYQPVPLFFQDAEAITGFDFGGDGYSYIGWPGDLLRSSAPKISASSGNLGPSSSQFDSRLPSLHPDEGVADDISRFPGCKTQNRHLLVSAECRQRKIDDLRKFSTITDKEFALPSRHVLSRFLGGYFNAFHDHFPFLHIPTFEPGEVSVEFFLAMMSLGARYTRELEISIDFFKAAKTIAFERIRKHREDRPAKTFDQNKWRSSNATSRRLSNRRDPLPWIDGKGHVVEMIETVLLLVAVTTWSEPGSASDALLIRGVLDSLIRDEEILHAYATPPGDWKGWICHENLKRTIFVAFCFLNIHTIAFDVPPLLLVSEVGLDLPCSEREWRAESETEWKNIRETAGQKCQDFRRAFACLFVDGNEQPEESRLDHGGFSSLGGCALVHALIQQIWLIRNSRLPHLRQSGIGLSADEMNSFEVALKRWAVYWERNQESSMDPLSPYGPVAFTSVALLRLAYIRLNVDLGPIRCLSSWDPHLIAQSLHESPPIQRCEKLTRAALHCAHALSIPVKLGLNHIAQTQVLYWSNQHALCSLECAVLLAKWLEAVTATDVSPSLTPAEERLLNFVIQLVSDTEYKVSQEDIIRKKPLLNAMTTYWSMSGDPN